MPLSDQEILDVMEAALTLLGSANGASLRGDAALHAARKILAGLILHLSGASEAPLDEQFDTIGPKSDPSTLQ